MDKQRAVAPQQVFAGEMSAPGGGTVSRRAAHRTGHRRNPLAGLWRSLNSTRFVIFLLIALALASILGVLLTEKFPTSFYGAEQHYRAEYGDRMFESMVSLGIFNPFRSFWFHSLLLTLSASLIACSITRLRVTVRAALGTTFRRSADDVMALKLHARIPLGERTARTDENASVLGQVKRALQHRRYAVHVEPQDHRTAIAASRGSISHAGPYLTHVGLLLLLVGGVVSGLGGRSETVWLEPGEQWNGMDRGFSARLVNFEVPRNDRGEVLQYISEIEVIDNERGGYTQKVTVNHPLRHRGVSLYQSSFRAVPGRLAAARFSVGDADGAIDVPFGEAFTLPDGRSITLTDFVSDFRIVDGQVASASDKMRNPAVRVVLNEAGHQHGAQWLFLNHPDFNHSNSALADLRILDVVPLYATGLNARTSPGDSLIWAGFVFASIGLLLSFYLTHQRFWVVVEPQAVFLGGIPGRGEAIRREFNAVRQAITSALAERKATAS